jgi:putative FmdB family regulatory protein
MPLYEYECESHGIFELVRSMTESSAPAECIACSAPSRRIISAANLGNLPRSTVRAHERNEKSRHEPRVERREVKAAAGPSGPPRMHSPSGGRPWVLEHG